MVIEFYRKHVYGTELMYISNERTAFLIKQLTNRSTMTASDMNVLEKLGFTFEEVFAPRAS